MADGYKLDIPGLGSATLSQSAAECGEGNGGGAIVGQINPTHGMAMPHYVSISPLTSAGRAYVESMRTSLSVPTGANAQQALENQTLIDYKKKAELMLQMDDVRAQMKQALISPQGSFACRHLKAGRYEVLLTVYQKMAPRAPYDNLGLKEITVIRYFGQEIDIPMKTPSATVRADRFTLLGSAPPGL